MANGGKLLAAALAATPAAPLAPFVGLLSSIFGGWMTDHEMAKVAQRYLRDTRNGALAQGYYEAYTALYNQGVNIHNAGGDAQWPARLKAADEAGKAARHKVAEHLDNLERDSYRAWMAKGRGLMGNDDDHLWEGWLLGKAGITGHPKTSEFNDGSPGGWLQIRATDGMCVRWNWKQGHPDYEGTVLPPVSDDYAAMVAARAEQRNRDRVLDEQLGRGPGQRNAAIKDDKRTGTHFEDDFDGIPEPPPRPRETPPPAPPPAPPPPPTPPPSLPLPAPDTAPKPPPVEKVPRGVPPGRKGRNFEV
ncbi:hypothetical protein [Myxococcus sp. RHSTA-1-4]|uniref:hypothetical protein n=1 Tax=Myxococcus sp. RHSTA-1-4 TaxID=2874601 RepID=UPI001CC027CD|nr:hypothetical protein [Myxococcus sp. RHSTA-1-4]MBZ4422021.1 hypothetical protein [Myxococcus sp. RHSTA-1-4]